MLEYTQRQTREAFLHRTRELEVRLAKVRAKEQRQRQRLENGERQQKRTVCGRCSALKTRLLIRCRE